MNRYVVAFASVLVGMVLTIPYAVLKFRDLPPIPPRLAGHLPRQMTFEEMLVVTEICVVFYAVAYFVGRRIYVALGQRRDLQAVQELSSGHMRLLHSFAGAFMVASPWLEQPLGNRNPLTMWLSIAIGVAMLSSGLLAVARWTKANLTSRAKVQFEPKWKEELICTMDGRRFVIEITMGVLTVYFPTKSRWEATAPDWAKPQWERAREDLSAWCLQQNIPLQIEDNAWAEFD